MRLTPFLSRLPNSLLVTSLALAVTSLPVESVELNVLTPDNFKDTITHGVWFIEHFSPYCRHCRNFAPTWEQLVEYNEKLSDPGIHLAQVNCAVHGDLCRDNKIDGYPQMNLYRDGQFVETFEDPRDYETLVDYISKHARPTATDDHPSEEQKTFENRNTIYNPTGTVTSLNEATFQEVINGGHAFVKFFAPWCGHCKRLAPAWIDLAKQMKNKLTVAEVNCDEHSSICRSQGVTGYPMLFYYSGKQGVKTEYTGGRKIEQLKAFAERISLPPVQELGFGELPQLVAENPVVYLLLRQPSDDRALTVTTESSQVLFGTPPVYVSSSQAIYDHYSVDPTSTVLLALKDHELDTPSALFKFTSAPRRGEKDIVATWMLRNRLPTSLELDSDTFQEVMNAQHKPLVVIVAAPINDLESTAKKVQEIANQWKDNKAEGDVVFTWMDAGKWSSWLKNMYGIKQDALPRVVVTNHSRLVYYDVDQVGDQISLTASSILSAINGAIHGTINYKHSENIVERLARYLNDRLTSFEAVISNNPWRVVFFVLLVIAVLVYVIRRFVFDEPPVDLQYRRGEGSGKKTARLD